ncbi:hypothetical protein LCGC14_2577040 [marine sediment metagenome]|uniref:Uncharacterized protein n=1 Tax=marine sediment metagenome TaxID=412755 RepID=A0A0F9B3G7_9ZZZZ
MIFISPKGMTVTEWFKEIRKRNNYLFHARKGSAQKRTDREYAHKPLFGHVRTFFKRISSTAVRS